MRMEAAVPPGPKRRLALGFVAAIFILIGLGSRMLLPKSKREE